MNLGIARTADAEIGTGRADIVDKIHRMAVCPAAAVGGGKLRRKVAAECHDIFDARSLHVLDARADGFLGGGDAGEMRQHGHIVVLLDVFRDLQRVAGGAAACAVGDAHEGGAELGDFFGCSFDGVERGVGLGWEYLKGEVHAVAGEKGGKFHLCIFLFWNLSISNIITRNRRCGNGIGKKSRKRLKNIHVCGIIWVSGSQPFPRTADGRRFAASNPAKADWR